MTYQKRFTDILPGKSPILIILSALFILTCTSPSAFAARQVRVGIFDGSPAREFSIDLIDAMAKKEDWQVEYKIDSMANCLARLRSGEIDIMTAFGYSLERDHIADFTRIPMIQRWSMVFLPLHSTIKRTRDLEGKRVGILREGSTAQRFVELIEKFDIHCQLVGYDSFEEIMQGLEQGEIDAGVVVNIFGARSSTQYQVQASSIVFSPSSNYFAVPEGKNADLAATIDRYMDQWKQDPKSVYYQSMNRWLLGKEETGPIIPTWIYLLLALFVAGLLLLFIWTRLLKRMVNKRTRELSVSEARLNELIDLSPIGLVLCTMDGHYISANPAYQQITGYTLAELLHMSYRQLTSAQGQEQDLERAKVLETDGRYGPFETEIINKAGHLVTVRVSSMLVTRDNSKYTWSSVEDISPLKQAEQEKQEMSIRLQQTQKMEAIGTLAGGIAHDFNNILSVIIGYTDLACLKLGHNPEAAEDLNFVLSAARRARDLVRQILLFSRKRENGFEPLKIHDIILEACNMIRKTIPSSIAINLQLAPETGLILGDSTKIYQILINLCTNSSHAMNGDSGQIDICLTRLRLSEEDKPQYPKLDCGEYARLVVADNGSGIAEENLTRIFEPFFTTKEVGKGTGMGLSVIHGIVEDHGGEIRVESQIGEGTSFEILLPIYTQENPTAPKDQPENESLRGTEHILIVDDETALVEFMKVSLSAYGYQVTATSSPLMAYALFQEQPNRFDMVLSDQSMPELTGDKLAAKILTQRPDLPIVILTGYSSSLTEEKAKQIGISNLLIKPVEITLLLRELRAIFDSKSK